MKIGSKKFMNLINKLQTISEKSEYKNAHACAIIYGGKIISISENKFSSIPLHAEDCALRKIRQSCNTTLLVIRSKNNQIKSSKPCHDCIDLMIARGVKKCILFK